ncbi:MAG: ABC transporter substrate-binding protein [Lachnospiraceae bacterium]|nr:ABC transporter substrate-binding protein [Lachnospiraceae bacterium]
MMKCISRRDFMKGMVVGGAALGSAGVLSACGSSSSSETTETTTEETSSSSETTGEAELTATVTSAVADMDYYGASEYIYDYVLGDFYDTYMTAFDAETTSERYVLMAIAEAKLLESGVMLPLYSAGGNYAISRIVPRTTDYANAGSDSDRYHSALVATELISAEDIQALRDLWDEARGTGTYIDEAKAYMEEHGYELGDTYATYYTTDPQTYDVLATSKAADSDVIINTFDGLLEYDNEGVQQPALAESYEVSDDGLTWTFHIREGVTWVDSQGRYIADATADDFVAGFQHMLDAAGGLEWLVEGVIEGASEYLSGEITDFSQVGVSAPDDYTLVYTLCEPCSYFNTMLGYSCFAPLCRTYYTSMGGKFGIEFDASASDYQYGKGKDSIVYCGPYIISNATANATIIFTQNETYYKPEHVNVSSIVWYYNDGSDTLSYYNNTLDGTYSGSGLNANAIEAATADGNFDTYAYISTTNTTSYMSFVNVNRQIWHNSNDESAMVSPKDEEQQATAYEALLNQHFRMAVNYAWDRGSYLAQTKGEALKYASMRNTYTPGDFVYLLEETTVDINGTATTFPEGTFYGEILQAQLDADGSVIVAWDGTSTDLFDGWYNVDAAVEEMDLAVEELAAMGITVDADNPVYIDIPYPNTSETRTNMYNAMKQSIENALDGRVIVNLVGGTQDEWYYTGYNVDIGSESNYDLYDLSGWGPDYVDPSTYLDTMLPDGSGYMTKCLGLW